MKRIALLSDTHGHIDPKLEKYLEPCDEVWHAGDIGTVAVCNALEKIKPLRAVYGNIDGQDVRKVCPLVQDFMCEGVHVVITHIAGYPGKFTPEARALIQNKKPKLFICGHSHILKVMFDKQNHMLFMNPGAAGIHGFHHVKTLLRFTIDGDNIKDLEAIELGKRA